jgi:hypothetical protein
VEPGIKAELKAKAKVLRLPFEELVHLALIRLLNDLGNGEEIPLKIIATRRTVL